MTSALLRKHSFEAVFDSQQLFRLILEAISHPARTVQIGKYTNKLFGEHPALLTLALVLLDNEVSFDTCGHISLSEEIASLTLARKEGLTSADFVFVADATDIKGALENVKCGTLANPHKSATVIIQNGGEANCRLQLGGPGIDGQIESRVTQPVQEAIIWRDEQNYEYPQGIDLFFVSNNGELFAIPRLVRREVA